MTDLNNRIGALSPDKRALLEQHLLAKRAAAYADGDAIPRRRPDDPAPLSFSQLRLWFLDQWTPGDPSYNAAIPLRLDGVVDVGRLRAAFVRIVERHEALRTVFRSADGTPSQVVLDEWSFPLCVVEVSGGRDEELAALLRAEARRPFDLTADLMLRATLFRTGPEAHVLLVGEHHIALDGWSDTILFGELGTIYAALGEGRDPTLPELPVQYADFALWQRRRLRGPLLDRLVEYWRAALAGAPPLLELPTDRPRPPVQSFSGAHHPFPVGTAVGASVAELARQEGATPYMTLLAAFGATLFRWTGRDDVSIGTPIAGRGRVELEPLIGFFSNTLVLRLRMTDDLTFRQLVRRAKDTALGAYEHQDLPFEKVVEALSPPRDARYNPLFQVNFRVQTTPVQAPVLPGIDVRVLDLDVGFSRFDLALEVSLLEGRLAGYVEYNEALFDAATAARLAQRFGHLLQDAVARPDAALATLAFARAPSTVGTRISGFGRRPHHQAGWRGSAGTE